MRSGAFHVRLGADGFVDPTWTREEELVLRYAVDSGITGSLEHFGTGKPYFQEWLSDGTFLGKKDGQKFAVVGGSVRAMSDLEQNGPITVRVLPPVPQPTPPPSSSVMVPKKDAQGGGFNQVDKGSGEFPSWAPHGFTNIEDLLKWLVIILGSVAAIYVVGKLEPE